ncbi:MAG: ABC transporter substrate-binding protein [Methylobacteriaceae bacterium]|nr:ABC transporter substrate-binding protein [Methylobacteriaceae bacterium]
MKTAQLSRRSLVLTAAAFAAALAAPARAQSALPLRIGYVPVIGAAALYVLDRAGWAREAGLDIRLAKFDSGPAAIQAIASGSLDMLAIGIAPIAVARSRGLDVQVVSAAGTGGSAFLAAPPLADAFAKSGNDPAAALAAFHQANGRAAKIGTLPPGGVPTVALNYWFFKTHKVVRADVEIVAIGIEALQGAILAGAVDGGTVLEPSATIVQRRNPRLRVIATARDKFPEVPGVVIAATGAFEKAHPDAVGTMVALVLRATELIQSDPKAAAPYVAEVLGGGLVTPDIMAAALASPAAAYVTDPRAIVAPVEKLLEYQVEIGDFATAPKTERLFETKYFDAAQMKMGK